MNIKSIITFILLNCAITGIAQNSSSDAFKTFIQKEKFNSKGNELSLPELKPIVEKSLHRLANSFEFIANSSNPEEKFYFVAMTKATNELKPYELDLSVHDKTLIANYIEELMDLVQLQSSNGILNRFVYGFEPTKK